MPDFDVKIALAHLSRIADMSDAERAGYAELGHIPRYVGAVTMQCCVCSRDVEVGPMVAAEVATGTPLVCIFDVSAYTPMTGGTATLSHLGGDPAKAYQQGVG